MELVMKLINLIDFKRNQYLNLFNYLKILKIIIKLLFKFQFLKQIKYFQHHEVLFY